MNEKKPFKMNDHYSKLWDFLTEIEQKTEIFKSLLLSENSREKDLEYIFEELSENFRGLIKTFFEDEGPVIRDNAINNVFEGNGNSNPVLKEVDVINIAHAIHDVIYIEQKKDSERIALLLDGIYKEIKKIKV